MKPLYNGIIQHLKISSSQIEGVSEVFKFLMIVLEFFFFQIFVVNKKVQGMKLT